MIFFIALVLAILRIRGHKSQSFQAAAHFYVAWLLAAWWFRAPEGLLCLWTAIILSVVEVGCFLWFRAKKQA